MKKSKFLKIIVICVLFICVGFTIVVFANGIKNKTVDKYAVTLLTDCFIKDSEAIEYFEEKCYEDTGIKLKIINSSNRFWENFLISRLTLGNSADIIKAPENITYFAKNGHVIPITDYINNSEGMKKIYKNSPEVFETYRLDGEIYGIGKYRTTTRVLWIRKDILDNLGIKVPVNIDEFTNMLYELKKYGDKHGLSPMLINGDVSNLNIFASAYSIRMDVFMKGQVYVEPFFLEEFKEFATYMKYLYDEKYIDSTFPSTRNYNTIRKKFGEGKSISIVMWDNIYTNLSTKLENNNIKDYEIIPVPAFETEKGVFGIEYLPPGDPFSITDQCENIEDAFSIIEWMYTDEDGILSTCFGIEGYNYKLENGKIVGFERVKHFGQGFPPIDKEFEFPFDLPESAEKLLYHYENICKDLDRYKDIIPKKTVAFNNVKYSELYPKIQNKRNELFFKYLTNELSYDEMINNFKEFYYRNNIDKILEELNGD